MGVSSADSKGTPVPTFVPAMTEHLWQAFTTLSDVQELISLGDSARAVEEVNHAKHHLDRIFSYLGDDARMDAMRNTTTCTLETPYCKGNKEEKEERVEQLEVSLEYRRCKTCNVFLTEGYVIGGGEEYFCNNHEPEYFKNLFDADPDGDTYWTQWDDVETSS